MILQSARRLPIWDENSSLRRNCCQRQRREGDDDATTFFFLGVKRSRQASSASTWLPPHPLEGEERRAFVSSRLGGGGRQSLYFASKKSGDDVTALAWLYLVVLVVDIVTHLRVRCLLCCRQRTASNAHSVSQISRKEGGEVSKSAKVFKKQKLCCAPPPLHDSLSHRLSKLPSQPSWRLLLLPMYFSPFPLLLSDFTFLPPLFLFPPFLESESVQAQRGENWVTHYCTGERGEEEGEGRRLGPWGLIAITQKALWALGAPNPCPQRVR